MITKFKAVLCKGEKKGSWTYVVMPKSAEFFGSRGLVKVKGMVNGEPLKSSFMPLGDGTHMLPVKKSIRDAIGKDDGDEVTVCIQERIR